MGQPAQVGQRFFTRSLKQILVFSTSAASYAAVAALTSSSTAFSMARRHRLSSFIPPVVQAHLGNTVCQQPVFQLLSLWAACWASRLVVNEVVSADVGPAVPVSLHQQLLSQAVPLLLAEALPGVAEQLLHQAPEVPHPRPAASPEADSFPLLRIPALEGRRPQGPPQPRRCGPDLLAPPRQSSAGH